MSTARTYTRAAPSSAQVRRANQRRLGELQGRRDRLEAAVVAERERWGGRFAAASHFLDDVEVPEVPTEGTGDLGATVAAATGRLVQAERELATAVAACMAEHERLRARQPATRAEVTVARKAGAGVARRRSDPVDLGQEAASPVLADVNDQDIPDPAARVDKVAAILARGAVPPEAAAPLYDAARSADTRVNFEGILARARRAVVVARDTEVRREADRRQAGELLEHLVGVPGPGAEEWRSILSAVIDGGGDLPGDAAATVARVVHRSLREVWLAELERLGLVNVRPKGDEGFTGTIYHDGFGATQVVADDDGIVISTVVPHGLSPDEVSQAEWVNCTLGDRFEEGLEARGVPCEKRSDTGVGTLPVRVDASLRSLAPGGVAAGAGAGLAATPASTDKRRRRLSSDEEREV